MTESDIDAINSPGFINQPEAEVDQHIGDKVETKEYAKRDIIKIFKLIFNVSPEADPDAIRQIYQRLEPLLNSANESEIAKAYAQVLPQDSRLLCHEAVDLHQMLEQIREFYKIDDFSNKIKDIPDNKPQETLKSFLLLVLRPDQIERGKFRLKSWVIPNSRNLNDCTLLGGVKKDETSENREIKEDNSPELSTEDSYLLENPLEELPKLIVDCLNESKKYLQSNGTYELNLELFLPNQYLCDQVLFAGLEQCKILHRPGRKRKVHLGSKYPITIRLTDRLDVLSDEEYWNDWQTNWKRVESSLNKTPSNYTFDDLDEPKKVGWDTYCTSFRANEDKIGLKITSILTEDDLVNLLDVIIDAAIPIAVWPNKKTLSLDLTDEILADKINNLILSARLIDLPRNIYKERADSTPEKHFSHHLSVVWDNPNRLPRDFEALIPLGQ